MRIAKLPYSIWLAVLLALAIFANWPIRTGLPVGFITYAGFPWVGVEWIGGDLTRINGPAIVLDAAIWLVVIVVLPIGLALRTRSKPSERKNAA